LTRSWRSGKITAMARPSSALWEGLPLKRLHVAYVPSPYAATLVGATRPAPLDLGRTCGARLALA